MEAPQTELFVADALASAMLKLSWIAYGKRWHPATHNLTVKLVEAFWDGVLKDARIVNVANPEAPSWQDIEYIVDGEVDDKSVPVDLIRTIANLIELTGKIIVFVREDGTVTDMGYHSPTFKLKTDGQKHGYPF